MLPVDMPLLVCSPIRCQNVGLQVRERFAIYWSVHWVLIHVLFFSITVSSCQNAVSEIVGRMEQKTQEKEKKAWALCLIYWKVVMEKETCLALFQRGQLPQMDKSYKGVNFCLKIEEASFSTSQALPAPPFFQPRFISRIMFFQERTLPQIYILLKCPF